MGWYLRSWKGCRTTCPVKKISKDKKRAWLGQPHLIKNLEKKFGEHFQDDGSYNIPGTPKYFIVRPTVDSEKFSMEDQQEY